MFYWRDQICFFCYGCLAALGLRRVLPILFDHRSSASHLVYFCRPISPRLSRPRRLRSRKIFRCEEWDTPYSFIRDRTCVDVVLVVVLVLETKASEGGRRRCLRFYN